MPVRNNPSAGIGVVALDRKQSAAAKRDLRLGFLISDVARLQFRYVDLLMRPSGITRSQWLVVTFLSRREGLTQSDLAATLDMSRVNLGDLLDKLEVNGLVKRTPHPADGRAKCVFLTRKGIQLFQKIVALQEKHAVTMFAQLDDDDRDTLVDLLRRIRGTLKALDLGPPDDD